VSEALAPWFVEPGHLAIGYVAWPGTVAADATYRFEVHATPGGDPASEANQDLFVASASAHGQELRGRVQNLYADGVGSIIVTLMCFGQDEMPTDADHVPASPSGVDKSGATDFREPLSTGCGVLLAAATGLKRNRNP